MLNSSMQIPELLAFRESGHTIVDVRSPAEFAAGHIPGAIDLPLFDDEERADVGTLYHQQGRGPAVTCGLKIVRRKLPFIAEQVSARLARRRDGGPVALHCWRGGMRSRSMAWLLHTVGYDVRVLEGGYKAWRRWVHRQFDRPWPLVVMSGLTGCGKTRLLHRLSEMGEAMIDLEGMANHRGSAFGGVGKGPQPTVEQFENQLALALWQRRTSPRIWVEDESHNIGRVVLPRRFHEQLRAAPAVYLDVPIEVRRQLIVDEYGNHARGELVTCIRKISKRLGGQNVIAAEQALGRGDLTACTDILLGYYDRTYRNAMASPSRQVRTESVRYATEAPTSAQAARAVCAIADQLMSVIRRNVPSDLPRSNVAQSRV